MKTPLTQYLFIILLFALSTMSYAQRAGDLDRTFNYGRGNNYQFNLGYGPSREINSLIQLPDGKILIAGNFMSYSGTVIYGIARLNIDGTIDTSFNSGAGGNGPVLAFALQPDGKILIGGYFTTYDGYSRNRIARINSNGRLDTSFNVGTGVNGNINTIAIQPDGKVLIGGSFNTFNSFSRNNIARLNSDGSLDNSFNVGTGTDSYLYKIVIQQNGKILIGGNFSSYNGTQMSSLARLNYNGSIDNGFNIGSGVTFIVFTISLQMDNKILIGGYSFIQANRIARLNPNGSLDNSFNIGTGAENGAVLSMLQQPDGKILLGGNFNVYNGDSINFITRINANGSLDNSFNPGTGVNANVNSIALQSDGKILLGGSFSIYNDTLVRCIARINNNGSLDNNYNLTIGPNSTVKSLSIQPDGKILIAGYFTSYNGTSINHIARLNFDGSLDTSFNIGINRNIGIFASALQNDGKILISGGYYSNDSAIYVIARLNSDGSLDSEFSLYRSINNVIRNFALQDDGKIVIGGNFIRFTGAERSFLERLNPNGSIDSSFNIGSGADGTINSMELQPDGKILIGGEFSNVNNIPKNKIARLNNNGSLDNSFHVGAIINNYTPYIKSIKVQNDGKILIAGSFNSYNGISRNNIARLNSDGSLDSSFNIGLGANSSIIALAIQRDRKILIGGYFNSFDGITRNRIARLNVNGSLDSSFFANSVALDFDMSFALQSDSKILIGGITGYNNLSTPGICRIYGRTCFGSPTSSTIYRTICQGTSFTFGSQTLLTEGIYTETFTGSNGCDSVVTLNLFTRQQPNRLTVSRIDSNTLCTGAFVLLQANEPASNYLWSNGSTTQVNFIDKSGIYTVTTTNEYGCVSPPSQAISVVFDTVFCIPIITLIRDSLTTQIYADSYNWYRNGTLLLSANNQKTIPFPGPGTYTVQGVFTGRGLGRLSAPLIINGIEDKIASSIKIYPIPAHDNFTVELDKPAQIQIINTLGQVVYTQKVNEGTNTISTSSLSSGMYTVLAEGYKPTNLVITK